MRWQESRDWGVEAASFYALEGVLLNTDYKSHKAVHLIGATVNILIGTNVLGLQ